MKVVVAHVPAGSGHQRAAEAIAFSLGTLAPEASVVLLNGLDGMDALYRWTFTRGYLGMIHRWPLVWGAAYGLSDWRLLRPLAERLHRISNAWHGRPLEEILRSHQPDVIVGTHFFPMEVAAWMKRSGRISARLITVITDLIAHSVWVVPGIDRYVVGSAASKEDLRSRGVSEERIQVLGVPIDPRFGQEGDRRALCTRLGLNPEQFTVLVASGGFGTGPVTDLIRFLGRVQEPMQVLVVSGKNPDLFQQLERMRRQIHHAMKVYGFVSNMHELMAVSNIMLSKPGGLSCAEAMARGLPLLLVAAIPGQESRNARVTVRMGTALQVTDLRGLPSLIGELRRQPARLLAMARRAKEMAHPEAASAVARLALLP